MLTKQKESKRLIKAKGILVEISAEGLHIEDEKEGTVDIVKFDDFKIFLDKTVSFSITDSLKEEMEDEEEV